MYRQIENKIKPFHTIEGEGHKWCSPYGSLLHVPTVHVYFSKKITRPPKQSKEKGKMREEHIYDSHRESLLHHVPTVHRSSPTHTLGLIIKDGVNTFGRWYIDIIKGAKICLIFTLNRVFGTLMLILCKTMNNHLGSPHDRDQWVITFDEQCGSQIQYLADKYLDDIDYTIYSLTIIFWSECGRKHTGCFFSHWYPPKKLKYGKPRLGVSTST